MLVNVLNNLNQRKTRQHSDISFNTYEDKIKLLFLTLLWRSVCSANQWIGFYMMELSVKIIKIITKNNIIMLNNKAMLK